MTVHFICIQAEGLESAGSSCCGWRIGGGLTTGESTGHSIKNNVIRDIRLDIRWGTQGNTIITGRGRSITDISYGAYLIAPHAVSVTATKRDTREIENFGHTRIKV